VSEKKIYSRNPISEALIDVQLDQLLTVSSADLRAFGDLLDGKYPDAKERQMVQTTFQLESGKPVQSQAISIEGFEFWNSDKTEVIQARKNGFSFSRLKPYQTWEQHCPSALKYFGKYREKFGAQNATRLAVRFINLIRIPETKIELRDYFNAGPEIPPALPQDLESFLYRVVTQYDANTKAVITIAPGSQAPNSAIEIMLDIDVFCNTQVPISDGFDKIFEKLHIYAENIFEAYITDKTREVIK
jgi:uncharacterized protein (TIGR04255 family)